MSDEHIDRSLARAPTPEEPTLRSAVQSAVLSAQHAISAYWATQKKIPLFILKDQITPRMPDAAFTSARLIPHRSSIFDEMVKGSVGIEIGTQTGAFARIILDKAAPAELHLVDVSYDQFEHELFADEIRDGRVTLHTGFSWDVIKTFPLAHFDWIYLDASHAYEHVTQDIEAAWERVKPGGLFIFNDFTNWSPLEMTHYGVMQAVSDFVIRSNGAFEIAYLALHRVGYHDLALRRVR